MRFEKIQLSWRKERNNLRQNENTLQIPDQSSDIGDSIVGHSSRKRRKL